jgi:spore germination protein YaaH
MEKIFYRVQTGDTVFSIAKKFDACIFDLIFDNNLALEVSAGDVILIHKPDVKTYLVMPFDTISSICEKFCISREELLFKNKFLPYVFYGIKIKI